jgi:hypothetical protein
MWQIATAEWDEETRRIKIIKHMLEADASTTSFVSSLNKSFEEWRGWVTELGEAHVGIQHAEKRPCPEKPAKFSVSFECRVSPTRYQITIGQSSPCQASSRTRRINVQQQLAVSKPSHLVEGHAREV